LFGRQSDSQLVDSLLDKTDVADHKLWLILNKAVGHALNHGNVALAEVLAIVFK